MSLVSKSVKKSDTFTVIYRMIFASIVESGPIFSFLFVTYEIYNGCTTTDNKETPIMPTGRCPSCGGSKEFETKSKIDGRKCPMCAEPLEVAPVSSSESTVSEKKKPRLSKEAQEHITAIQEEYKKRHKARGPSWLLAFLFLVLGLAIGTPGGILIARYVIPPETQAVYVSVPAKTEPTFHRVKYVTDGDTFALETGERVRIVGVNCPESVGRKREYYGKEASNFSKTMLVGKRIRLKKDQISGDRDGFGRMLRYVIQEDGADYGLMLIEKGYGRVHPKYSFDKKSQ
jgi:endonuclease YncB( thermonuclease family)